MAQCLLHHGWLVLLKTSACGGLPIFFEVTTNWRAGCQKLACPVRREGRPESSSLPLSRHARPHADTCPHQPLANQRYKRRFGKGTKTSERPPFVSELNLLRGTAFPNYDRQRRAGVGAAPNVQHRSNRYRSNYISGRGTIIRKLVGLK